ncbi:ATP-binding cassette domain-containing protein [bacterium]|nr:ATP-binding cassette domain-containing protein [bacterium]
MIELYGVKKSFDDQIVLRDIGLTIPKGRTTVVVGQSGCGKSVLLRVILRLTSLDDGKIIINGMDTSEYSEHEMMSIRRKVGMLFQGSALFDSMTVWENVAYPLLENGNVPIDEIDKRVLELLDFTEMGDAVDKLPGALSGGMKKRVALARALVANPDFIFYDEPTTGLDPITASKINTLIRNTQEKYGATSVVVTHDMVSALTVGDLFAFLDAGIIAFVGEQNEFLNNDVAQLQKFLKKAAPDKYVEKFAK